MPFLFRILSRTVLFLFFFTLSKWLDYSITKILYSLCFFTCECLNPDPVSPFYRACFTPYNNMLHNPYETNSVNFQIHNAALAPLLLFISKASLSMAILVLMCTSHFQSSIGYQVSAFSICFDLHFHPIFLCSTSLQFFIVI